MKNLLYNCPKGIATEQTDCRRKNTQTKNPDRLSGPFDTHPELLIKPYKAGIQIVKPEASDSLARNSIHSLFSISHSVYFLNYESQIIDSNTACTELLGVGSISEARYKRAEHFFNKKASDSLYTNDNEVICNQQMKIIAEPGLRLDGSFFSTLAFKFPWYHDDKVVGIFGCSLITSDPSYSSLAEIIRQLLMLGIFDSSNLCYQPPLLQLNSDVLEILTPREVDVLKFILRAKTAKQIGKILGISNKTVEQHTAKILTKLGFKSKLELIDMFLSDKLIN